MECQSILQAINRCRGHQDCACERYDDIFVVPIGHVTAELVCDEVWHCVAKLSRPSFDGMLIRATVVQRDPADTIFDVALCSCERLTLCYSLVRCLIEYF